MAPISSVDRGAAEAARRRAEAARIAAQAQAAAAKVKEEAARKPQPQQTLTAFEGPRKVGAERLTGEKASPVAKGPLDAAPADPKARAGWWKQLSPTEQMQAVSSDPKKVGSLDGLPASVRDTANRQQLKNELTQLTAEADKAKKDYLDNRSLGDKLRDALRPGSAADEPAEKFLPKEKQHQLENARAVQKQLERTEKEVGSAQLLVYDSAFVKGEGRAAIVAGNLDTAKHVSVSVPGLNSDVRDYMDNITSDALNLHKAAGKEHGEVATVAWMGYDAPGFQNVASDNAAENGAKLLAADVAGIRASREGNQPHLTVIGHSYGSTTASIAADKNGLRADDLVLIGSPGAGSAKSVKDYDGPLANGHVWSGSASRDFVSWLNGSNLPGDPLGQDPTEDLFGAKRFTAEATDRGDKSNFEDHSKYYRAGSESLGNLADIVTGNYGGVDSAKHRYGEHDWFKGNRVIDPETQRPVS
ncbi:alpha/beta hydrolase [Myxococcus sp. MISCRS1]|uniref:alpha/beta hydrolase n=1 Tax=Myxococcus sp. MISCRS1 TaxID=2996786 RepID=UPI002272271C|nr:alpha/beta hydrolase [Myxococcus sp. MISCRS1]MCY0997626.1 alpha/beta hydrolase [Myxococcus sp. MISCRS1]BDT32356.1 alpha/beta hydrolase [Myxococcus sp. MH1]